MFPRDYYPSVQAATSSTTSPSPFGLDGNALVYTGADGTRYLVDAELHPANLAGLRLWLRADTITGVVDGGSVGTWNDSSGQGRNAVAPSGAQPTFRAVARNGRPALRFDGVSQFMNGPASNWRSFFAVAWCDPAPTPHMSLWGASPTTMDLSVRRLSTGPNYCHGNVNDFAPASAYRIDGTATNQVPNGYWHVVSCLASSTQTFAYEVGGTGLWPTRRWLGMIAEILVYDSALSVLDFQKVEQYLAMKYGLPMPR